MTQWNQLSSSHSRPNLITGTFSGIQVSTQNIFSEKQCLKNWITIQNIVSGGLREKISFPSTSQKVNFSPSPVWKLGTCPLPSEHVHWLPQPSSGPVFTLISHIDMFREHSGGTGPDTFWERTPPHRMWRQEEGREKASQYSPPACPPLQPNPISAGSPEDKFISANDCGHIPPGLYHHHPRLGQTSKKNQCQSSSTVSPSAFNTSVITMLTILSPGIPTSVKIIGIPSFPNQSLFPWPLTQQVVPLSTQICQPET